MSKELEEGLQLNLDFEKTKRIAESNLSVIPVAVQNYDTGEVILIAYINREALKHSLESRVATFWSTSRDELWVKGATSGATFELIEAFVNCEQNSLVFKVRPQKEDICHTKNEMGRARNCFYRKILSTDGTLENIDP